MVASFFISYWLLFFLQNHSPQSPSIKTQLPISNNFISDVWMSSRVTEAVNSGVSRDVVPKFSLCYFCALTILINWREDIWLILSNGNVKQCVYASVFVCVYIYAAKEGAKKGPFVWTLRRWFFSHLWKKSMKSHLYVDHVVQFLQPQPWVNCMECMNFQSPQICSCFQPGLHWGSMLCVCTFRWNHLCTHQDSERAD